MKQTFYFIISLLPFVAAAAILAWLLPVRVTLTLLIFCQMALFGELLKQRKSSSDNPETTERPDSSETPTPHEQA